MLRARRAAWSHAEGSGTAGASGLHVTKQLVSIRVRAFGLHPSPRVWPPSESARLAFVLRVTCTPRMHLYSHTRALHSVFSCTHCPATCGTHTRTRTRIRTHTHTHAHTHTHTHTQGGAGLPDIVKEGPKKGSCMGPSYGTSSTIYDMDPALKVTSRHRRAYSEVQCTHVVVQFCFFVFAALWPRSRVGSRVRSGQAALCCVEPRPGCLVLRRAQARPPCAASNLLWWSLPWLNVPCRVGRAAVSLRVLQHMSRST